MQARLEAQKVSPAAYQALVALENFVRKQSKLEPALIELVKMRASQINGCAYCIDMHSKDARAEGETEQRIYALSAWEETPFFTDRERAARERSPARDATGPAARHPLRRLRRDHARPALRARLRRGPQHPASHRRS